MATGISRLDLKPKLQLPLLSIHHQKSYKKCKQWGMCFKYNSKETKQTNEPYPCIQLIIHKFYDDIVLHPQKFCNTWCDPWLQTVSIHFWHVHLKQKHTCYDCRNALSRKRRYKEKIKQLKGYLISVWKTHTQN